MNRSLINVFCMCLLTSCSKRIDTKNEESDNQAKCTFDQVNAEISDFSESPRLLETVFHLNQEEIEAFTKNESMASNKELKENIMLKFMSRLNDRTKLDSKCIPPGQSKITFSDISLYCIAKSEPMPFALATGGQNCTDPWISDEISLPINFTAYYPDERERITYRYLKYFYSKERIDYLTKYGDINTR